MTPDMEKEEDPVKTYFKNIERREIRRQKSEIYGEEIVENVGICAQSLRDIKGQYTRIQRNLEELEEEQADIVSFYNSGQKLRVPKGRNNSKNKLRKRVEIENIDKRMNELIGIIAGRRGVIENLRRRHQYVKEELIDLRRDEDCRRAIEVREIKELAEEETNLLLECWTKDPSWGWEEIEVDVNNRLFSQILLVGGRRRSQSLRKYRRMQIKIFKESGVKLAEGRWLTDRSVMEYIEHLYNWLEAIMDITYVDLREEYRFSQPACRKKALVWYGKV